jgi:hypothetical protein
LGDTNEHLHGKGIRTFKGMEGEGYNASLYRDGKLVALAVDDASGGPLQVEWKDRDSGRCERVEVEGYEGKKYVVNMSPEEKLLHDHAASLPDLVSHITGDDGKPMVMRMTAELFIEELVNDTLLLRDVRRMLRSKVGFIHNGKMMTGRVSPNNVLRAIESIRRDHPGALVLNGLPDRELLAALRALPR